MDKDPILRHTESTDDIKIFEGLMLNQRNQMQRLVKEFSDNFTDVPKTQHKVKTSTDVPIQMKPYPIPYALQDQVKHELQQMRDLGIIPKRTVNTQRLLFLSGKMIIP